MMRERIALAVLMIGAGLALGSLLVYGSVGWAVDSPLSEPARQIVSTVCAYGLLSGMVSVVIGTLTLGVGD